MTETKTAPSTITFASVAVGSVVVTFAAAVFHGIAWVVWKAIGKPDAMPMPYDSSGLWVMFGVAGICAGLFCIAVIVGGVVTLSVAGDMAIAWASSFGSRKAATETPSADSQGAEVNDG